MNQDEVNIGQDCAFVLESSEIEKHMENSSLAATTVQVGFVSFTLSFLIWVNIISTDKES